MDVDYTERALRGALLFWIGVIVGVFLEKFVDYIEIGR